ncbi:hypothetical protein OIU78_024582 [Salix suchowensis]|nr:hypothetical protein OIU78_024582 [Salix suchowensis]
MVWTGNLIDIQKFSEGGANLNIRLAYTELVADKKRNMKVIISMSVIGGATAIFICVFFSWKWMATHRERKLRSEETLSHKTTGNFPENRLLFLTHFHLPLFSSKFLCVQFV